MRKSSQVRLGITLIASCSVLIGASVSAQQASPTVERDAHGKIKRSAKAKDDFEKETGYPHGRPGYVIDHVIPLASGGRDSPSNMQWQTKEEAMAKDRWERGGFGRTARSHYSTRSYGGSGGFRASRGGSRAGS